MIVLVELVYLYSALETFLLWSDEANLKQTWIITSVFIFNALSNFHSDCLRAKRWIRCYAYMPGKRFRQYRSFIFRYYRINVGQTILRNNDLEIPEVFIFFLNLIKIQTLFIYLHARTYISVTKSEK